MTRVGGESLIGQGNNMSVFASAGYAYDPEEWDVRLGFRYYFGNSVNRDFVTRGTSRSGRASGTTTSLFDMFVRSAAQQTKDFNDGIVE